MKKALVSLISGKPDSVSGVGKKSASSEAEEFEINSNYLYVRFLPFGNKQVEALRKSDSNLVLFDHPLNYRVTDDSLQQEYHDQSLPDSEHPYFASVPVDYVFDKDIPHEIIKPLFLVQPIISALDTAESEVGYRLVHVLLSGSERIDRVRFRPQKMPDVQRSDFRFDHRHPVQRCI